MHSGADRARLRMVGLTEEHIERLNEMRKHAFLKECLWDEAERRRLEFAHWLVSTDRLTEEREHEQRAPNSEPPI